jgi:hypothetical protein
MKYQLWLASLIISVSACTDAASAERAARILERGQDHRVWSRVIQESQPDGQIIERISRYVEMASGLHYWSDAKDGRGPQWVDSQERFELFADGAIARHGPHQVILQPNASSAGLVDLLTADGKRFVSHVIGLAYTDLNGASLLIAEPNESIGEVTGVNEITYRDALEGPARCDIRYTYTRGGFEPDVVVRERLPAPVEYGLNPATTRIEIWTAFTEAHVPVKTETFLKPSSTVALPDAQMSDERMQFGAMEIGAGRAFLVDGDETSVRAGKNWFRPKAGCS